MAIAPELAAAYQKFYPPRDDRVATGAHTSAPRQQNPYFYPTRNYGLPSTIGGSRPGDFWSSDLGRLAVEEEPVAGVMTAFGDYNPLSGEGSFYESQIQRILQGYRQAQLVNPELFLRDFLDNTDTIGRIRRQYQLASPARQGIDYSRLTPRARLSPRGY